MPRLSEDRVVNDIRHNIGHFKPNESLRLGDADSAHGVVFGELDGYGDVAVKRHSNGQRAWREMHNLEEATKRGMDSLEPLGIATTGLGHYLVTRREPGLAHLGQVDWNINIVSPQLRTVAAPTLQLAGQIIADRHNDGVTNLDSQVKNIVVNAVGSPVLTDAERVLFDEPIGIRTTHADHDLTVAGYSVMYRGLLSDRSATYRSGFLTENLLGPYVDTVDNSNFSVPMDVREDGLKQNWVAFAQKGRNHS